LKPSLKSQSAAIVALLAAEVFVVTTTAQAPQAAQGAASAPPPPPARAFPAPTNLKVLPRDLTGQQVHDTMERWESSLGIQCAGCHAEDTDNLGPDGRPLLKFADDSKPMKSVARIMYTMTDEINTRYIARIDGSGVPVTCGTCHRGKMGPEPFANQPDRRPPPPLAALPGVENP